MRTDDEQIGRNLAAARETLGISQHDLAAAMRARGHAWSQSTVWSTEAGKRPVRLAEAVTLKDLLHMVDVEGLVRDQLGLRLSLMSFRATHAREEAASSVVRAVREMLTFAAEADEAYENYPDELQDAVLEILRVSPLWYVADAYAAAVHHEAREVLREHPQSAQALEKLRDVWSSDENAVDALLLDVRERKHRDNGEHPEASER